MRRTRSRAVSGERDKPLDEKKKKEEEEEAERLRSRGPLIMMGLC